MTPAMDIRAIIEARREALGLSKYDVVQRVKNVAKDGEVSESAIYRYLAGTHDLRSGALGLLLDVVGLTIKPK